MASKFGKVLKIDADILQKESLLFARVLIRTSYPKISKKSFPVQIDGKEFMIRVLEEDEVEPLDEIIGTGIGVDDDDEVVSKSNLLIL